MSEMSNAAFYGTGIPACCYCREPKRQVIQD
jgi:hypothetical protein